VKIKELIIYFAFLIIMIFQNLLYSGFNQNFLITIIGLCLILLDKEKRIYFLFFMIPFRSSLPFNLIIFLFIALLFFSFKFKLSNSLLFFFAIILIEFITSLESSNIANSLRFSLVLFTTYFIVNISPKQVSFSGKTIGLYFALGFISSGLLYLIVFSSYFNIESLLIGQQRLGALNNQLLMVHPNYLYFLNINANEIGINAIFSMIFLTFYFKRNVMFLPFFIMALIIGTLTFSRTFFLALAIFSLYILFKISNTKSFFIKIITIASLLVFFSIILSTNFEFLEVIIERYTISTNDDRIKITLGYFNLLEFMNIFFGKGAINYFYFYNQDFSVHNGFLEVFFSYGFFGLMLLLSIFWYLFHKSKNNTLIKVGLIIFIVAIMFHQLLGSVQLLFILSIFFILIKEINIYNQNEYIL